MAERAARVMLGSAVWALALCGAGTQGDTQLPPSVLADLSPDVRESAKSALAGRNPETAEALAAVYEAAPPFRFAAGPLVVRTDRRWYATAELEGPDAGGPDLVVRRWPGDTWIAFWVLPAATGEAGPVVVRGLRGDRLATALGEVAARWREREVAPGARLGGLLVTGDAGLGPEAREGLLAELEAVWARAELDGEIAATVVQGRSAGPLVPPASTTLPLGPADERVDPWQTVSGADYSLGLPPGILARRTDRGIPTPSPVPGGMLWIRGRFLDRDGRRVVLGDGERAGYVARIDEGLDSWLAGQPPLAAPGARLERREEFSAATEMTGCSAAVAERWTEDGFRGDWLVFRLGFENRGIELALPVLEGRQSPALFWIPLLWRDAGRPPASPPIDAAQRFGIRFERLTGSDRRDLPWVEGYLSVPGLRLELPVGWWPVVALRSRDGFPVDLLDSSGTAVGRIEPWPATARPRIEDGWSKYRGARRHRAKEVWRAANGAALFFGRDGSGVQVRPLDLSAENREAWRRMLDSAVVPAGRAGPEP